MIPATYPTRVDSVTNTTGQVGKDYTNVFEEGTVRWSADEAGFIPVQFFGV